MSAEDDARELRGLELLTWDDGERRELGTLALGLNYGMTGIPPDDNEIALAEMATVPAPGDTCDRCGPGVLAFRRWHGLTLCGHCYRQRHGEPERQEPWHGVERPEGL